MKNQLKANENIIFVNSGPKSWVIGMDIAAKLSESQKPVKIFSLGRSINTDFRILSPSRVWFQYKFTRNLGLHFGHLNWRLFFLDFASVSQSFKLFQNCLKENIWINEVRPIRAQLSALFGTSEIQPRAFKKRQLFFLILIKTSIQRSLSKKIKGGALDSCTIWVFNGREILEASVLEWAIAKGIKTKIFERASSSNKYEIYDKSPHCNNEWWEKIESFHRDLDPEDCQKDAEDIQRFIDQKSRGVDPFMTQKWSRFAVSETSAIPKIVEPFVCFFSVSTGEFSPFGKFESVGGYKSQFEALSDLYKACSELGIRLVIRRHPNSLGIDTVDREEHLWAPFRIKELVTYFAPVDRVNSYSLARKALCSFTWRSTIGFDLLSRGLPAYSMGPAKWAISEEVKAFDFQTLKDCLTNPKVSKEAQSAVHKYAHYFSKFGITLENFLFVERWGFKTKKGDIYKYYLM